MSSSKRGPNLIEDEVLRKLMAAAGKDDTVPNMLYFLFSNSCLTILRENNDNLESEALDTLMVDAFADFWDRITYSKIKPPLNGRLFFYFFDIVMETAEQSGLPFVTELSDADQKRCKYLASEALLYLLYKLHRRTENMVYQEFKTPLINLLKIRYSSLAKEPEAIYDEAMAAGIDNIRKGKLIPPLRARLTTIFARIARNRLINWFKRENRRNEIPVDDDRQFEQWVQEEINDNDYLEYLEKEHREVRKLWPKDDKDLVDKILNMAKAPADRYLRMRFIDEMSYAEMVEILKKEETITNEGALRARIFSALTRIRKALNLNENG